ncbi:hypothetical protein HOD29_03950 [archaeon]|jgi:hypothetical protein|nr:hypothetical protein [archaeon]
MKIIAFILIFLSICGLIIISNNDLAFKEPANVKTFFQMYLGWAENVYTNMRTITGNIISMDWIPE